MPLLLALLALSAAWPSLAADAPPGQLDLSRGWVLQTDPTSEGLARGWQRPECDDSTWRPIRVDANYEAQGLSYDGYCWYRLRFRLDAAWAGQPCLLVLGPVDDADETFLNGLPVGKTGVMGDLVTTTWQRERLYVLPAAALRPGAENVLAVRVWDQRGGGGIYRGPVQLIRMQSGSLAVASVAEQPWGLEIALEGGGKVRLQLYDAATIRVRAVPSGEFRPYLAHELLLARPEPQRTPYTLTRRDGALLLATDKLRVTVQERPFRLAFGDGQGRPLTEESVGPWWGGGWLGEALTCAPDEHFLGLGEAGPHIDRRGQLSEMWVIHSYEAEDIPVPFYLSSRGYGLLLCNSFKGQFDLAASRPDLVQFRASGGELDYFLMAAARPTAVLSAYTALTGRSPLPPRWAFGYWQSRAGWGGQKWALDLATRLRRDGFPLDVIHMDGWSDRDLRFSPQRFPDAPGFVRALRDLGVKVCIWETPFVHPDWRLFGEGLKQGYFARKPDSSSYYPVSAWVGHDLGLIDFLSPAACCWWQDAHQPVLELGIGAVKTDGGDTAEVPADAVFSGGATGHEAHNLYPLLFNRCVYEGQQRLRPDWRVINWTRTGYAGIQRYPCTWGGDEPSTFVGGRTLVRAGINAGACGIAFWSHDLGGFAHGRTAEYYVRSCQWGFLSPLARIHGIAENADPAISGNEPWVFGEQVEQIVRRYARLRYRLLPYLYSCAHEASATGVPMMRALPLEFPDDPATWACDYEYLLGRDLLVAPIVEESGRADLATSRRVYLPAGSWYDYWTDRVLRGPRWVTCAAPLDTLPLFVRAGAVLPCGPEVDHLDGPPDAALAVEVYARGQGSFELVEDDGETLAYRQGQVARTTLTQRESLAGGRPRTTVELAAPRGRYAGMPRQRPVVFRFHGLREGARCLVDGRATALRGEEGGRVQAVGPLTVRAAAVKLQVLY